MKKFHCVVAWRNILGTTRNIKELFEHVTSELELNKDIQIGQIKQMENKWVKLVLAANVLLIARLKYILSKMKNFALGRNDK